MMGEKSRQIAALEAALERQRGVSDRWREDWEQTRRELAKAQVRHMWLQVAKVHTDADGKRFVYLPENWPA